MCMVEQCNRVWILTKNPFPSVREIIDKERIWCGLPLLHKVSTCLSIAVKKYAPENKARLSAVSTVAIKIVLAVSFPCNICLLLI